MTKTIDVSGLNPEQIQQIHAVIETFLAANQLTQNSVTEDKRADFDPTPLFFESEIIQAFKRSVLYGNRT